MRSCIEFSKLNRERGALMAQQEVHDRLEIVRSIGNSKPLSGPGIGGSNWAEGWVGRWRVERKGIESGAGLDLAFGISPLAPGGAWPGWVLR